MEWNLRLNQNENFISADGKKRSGELLMQNEDFEIKLDLRSGEFTLNSQIKGKPSFYGIIDKEKGFFETIKFIESLIKRYL